MTTRARSHKADGRGGTVKRSLAVSSAWTRCEPRPAEISSLCLLCSRVRQGPIGMIGPLFYSGLARAVDLPGACPIQPGGDDEFFLTGCPRAARRAAGREAQDTKRSVAVPIVFDLHLCLTALPHGALRRGRSKKFSFRRRARSSAAWPCPPPGRDANHAPPKSLHCAFYVAGSVKGRSG